MKLLGRTLNYLCISHLKLWVPKCREIEGILIFFSEHIPKKVKSPTHQQHCRNNDMVKVPYLSPAIPPLPHSTAPEGLWLQLTNALGTTNNTYCTDATNNTYCTDAPYNTCCTDAPNNAYCTDAPNNAYCTDASNNTYSADAPNNIYCTDAPNNTYCTNATNNIYCNDAINNTYCTDATNNT